MNFLFNICLVTFGFLAGVIWSVLEDRLFPEDTE